MSICMYVRMYVCMQSINQSKIYIEHMQSTHEHQVRNRHGQAAYVRPRMYGKKINCSNLDLRHDTILVLK